VGAAEGSELAFLPPEALLSAQTAPQTPPLVQLQQILLMRLFLGFTLVAAFAAAAPMTLRGIARRLVSPSPCSRASLVGAA
jgi:hypothetical protein